MEIVYLLNGQKAYLIKKLDTGALIKQVMTFSGCEDEEFLTEEFYVKEYFQDPPVEKINDEIKKGQETILELTKKIYNIQMEKRELDNEIKKSTKTLIDSNNLIINKNDIINAKEIVMFTKDSPLPMRMDYKNKSMRGLELSINVKIGRGEQERSWGYKIYEEYKSCGDYLDEKYGILINPTEEKIDETIKIRLSEIKFPDYKIAQVDDKYLTLDLLIVKDMYLIEQKNIKKNKYKSEIERLTALLSED